MVTEDALDEHEIDEDLEDLKHQDDWADGAVLWSTDWTSETVVSQLERGNIDLNPSFQRRSAWTDKKQSLFIESLILGLPIPQLILAEDKNRKGSFIVIDGKQRLLAIRRFSAQKEGDGFKPLKLRQLNERDDLNGKTYSDLLKEDSEDLAAFQNSTVRTVVIRNWKSEAYLYEVFLRINTGSVQLSPQELRQALHPGEFSTFVDEASADSIELKAALNLKEPDFRMRDAEILLRYIAYKNFSSKYRGNLKLFLDDATMELNGKWDAISNTIFLQVSEMEEAFKFTRDVFGKDSYLRKWNGDEFERRKNRAIFDIMLHYFSIPNLRDSLAGKGDQIVHEFKNLCETDPDFLGAIERTTKSMEANLIRFNRWAAVLSAISGTEVPELAFDH